MLKKIFAPLLNLLKKKSADKPLKNRPLKIQTVYGCNTANNPVAPPLEPIQQPLAPQNIIPIETTADILATQKKLLQENPIYQDVSIEIATLDKKDILIGLTRHRAIHYGVFMYPKSMYYSAEWHNLEKQAEELQTGIATFKTMTDNIQCLKLVKKDESDTIAYLINKSLVRRIDWLRFPATHETDLAI